MRFSLIMGTLGRYDEVQNFLESMTRQTLQDFEIIIVDQNSGNDLIGLCESYRDKLSIKHVRIDRKGLSIARNSGLRVAVGDIIAFPDDDCEYPEDVLATIDKILRSNDTLDGLTAMSRDKVSGKVSNGRFSPIHGMLTPASVWRRHISYTIFLRKTICDGIGGMDELFGAGAKWAGGEESDYLLRAIYNGARVTYRPDVFIYHPDHVKVYDADAITHAHVCAVGFGALARKHLQVYKRPSQMPEALARLFRSLVGALLFLVSNRGRSRYYSAHLTGWIAGFLRYSPKGNLNPETEKSSRLNHTDL